MLICLSTVLWNARSLSTVCKSPPVTFGSKPLSGYIFNSDSLETHLIAAVFPLQDSQEHVELTWWCSRENKGKNGLSDFNKCIFCVLQISEICSMSFAAAQENMEEMWNVSYRKSNTKFSADLVKLKGKRIKKNLWVLLWVKNLPFSRIQLHISKMC